LKKTILISLIFCFKIASAQKADYSAVIKTSADKIEQQVIAWRHDFHQNPELANRETRTAAIIAKHLQSLGIEVKTGVAVTGVVGILRGDKPGPVIALRADMDALPVTENNVLPFASKVKAVYNGKETGVMHACGHDAHGTLTEAMLPSLQKSAGAENVILAPAKTGSEDFSFFAQKAPGLYFFIGGLPKGMDPKTSGPHHTPEFIIDDSAFKTGVNALCNLVFDYTSTN
jgi:metal-dependent amidase/aminoacylase/carboxypeptidase family protein